ncbi:uncharacterized protein LOC128240265 [Mya arenaria]|uniref:uncharacterized protein LOC128240265 n=1 Tax=Mya arenaria TaxID=6604 RepID=UPI0022E5F25F|nr:uncharacterized protein LOC128240265 [Mya arenaria]
MLTFLLSTVLLFGLAEGFCFMGGSPPEPRDSDRGPRACSLDNRVFGSGTTLRLPAPYCMLCSCSNGFYECCGYGVNGGPVGIEGCTAVRRPGSCDLEFVDATDPSRPCASFENNIRK